MDFTPLFVAIGWVVAILLVLLFLAGAKKASYSPADQAAEDDLQEAWLKAELAKKR